MKKLFEKKQWMMLSLVAALGVAVYLNYYFTQEPMLSASAGEGTVSGADIIDSAKQLGEASFVGADVSDVPKDTSDVPTGSGKVDQNAGNDTAGGGYFDKARASRNDARTEALRLLQETIGSASATATEQQAASQEATAIAENILKESNIENLVLAKGFPDCVAFVEKDHCQVVVSAAELQQQESVQVLEIVIAQTGIAPQNVQIVAAKNG